MPVLIPEALAIRKDEVRHLIQAAGLSLRDDEEVPGTEEAGVFAEVFPEGTPMGDNDEGQVTPMEDDAVVHEEDAAVVQLIEVTGKCGPPLA